MPESLRTRRIGVVDDEPIARESLALLVSSCPGHDTAWTAADGLEAIARAAADPPDAVLLDIRMPLCNGLEAAERLIAAHPKLSVVIVTAYQDFDCARTALRLGVRDFLVKPVSRSTLDELLMRLAQPPLRSASLADDVALSDALAFQGVAGLVSEFDRDESQTRESRDALKDVLSPMCTDIRSIAPGVYAFVYEPHTQSEAEARLFEHTAPEFAGNVVWRLVLRRSGLPVVVRTQVVASGPGADMNELTSLHSVTTTPSGVYIAQAGAAMALQTMGTSLGDVAEALRLSPEYLSRLFRRVSGETFSQFSLNMRLEAAWFKLCETTESVSNVAGAFGFRYGHHFARVFQHRFGCTPSALRRSS